ncbi:hypothetical protein [Eubacterium limosum]|uniref:hypothetical protein n=1 Tax=Eubacterium limosum TaxID=1736 RepID=UPI001064488D|nr:hypothetical protein [Eubacterium limosum]
MVKFVFLTPVYLTVLAGIFYVIEGKINHKIKKNEGLGVYRREKRHKRVIRVANTLCILSGICLIGEVIVVLNGFSF